MTSRPDTRTPSRRPLGPLLLRGVVSLGVLGAVVVWVLFALVLAAVQCDDNCSDHYTGDDRYAAQLVLALSGGLLATVGLALGFAPRRRTASRAALAVAALLAFLWWVWVPTFA